MSLNEQDLRRATSWLTLISLVILIVVGSFGCLCNIMTFTSRKLKNSTCAFYFLCTAAFELFILCFGGITRLSDEHFGSHWINQNPTFCKTRSFLNTAMSTIAMFLILLAAVDRYMATTSPHQHRLFGRMKVAYGSVSLTVLLGMGLNAHIFVFFDLYPLCVPRPGSYSLFFSIYAIVGTSLLPDGLILAFLLCTIRNVRRIRARAIERRAVAVVRQQRMRRIERQLVIVGFPPPLHLLVQHCLCIGLDDTRPNDGFHVR